MTKMTYAVALDKALEVVTDVEVRERLEALKASIVKRNASKAEKGYLSKEQKASLALADAVFAEMAIGTAYSGADVFEKFECITADVTIGKVRAALTRLAREGKVVRSEDHRKVFYTRVEA